MAVETYGYPAPDKVEVKKEAITLSKPEIKFIQGEATNDAGGNYESLFNQFKKEAIAIKRTGGDVMKTFKETKKTGFKRAVTLDTNDSNPKSAKKPKSS